ncbi:MAG: hypothetical protein HZA93_08740 [Verrucomicrobia bacterium]|nr:hypothetical protein [Verrucomicrobiota bacterium]
MALFMEANYAKKVGLPAYSSHQFAVTLRTELTDLSQLEKTCADLYQRLQAAVDTQIVNPGLVPSASGELTVPASRTAAPTPPSPTRDDDAWRCSARQRDLILKIVDENHLDKADIENLSVERFNAGVRQLNKLQASALIDELLETYASPASRRGGRARPAFSGRNAR